MTALTVAPGVDDAPRLALRVDDAAEALGMSRRHFERHVAPSVRVVYTGSLKLYPVAELLAWLEREAH